MDMQQVMLMQSISGTIYLLTITVVGIRLLALARRNRRLPELMLGTSLLVGGTFGATLEAAGLAMAATLEPEVIGRLLLTGKLCGLVALTCQGVFIWKVFRPDATWAPALVVLCFALAATAFAGFGSDLDKATQQQLNRGERLVEILKQPQYKPLPMEKQVSILFAGARGFLDPIPVNMLADYEKELYAYIEQSAPAVFDGLREKQEIDADLEEQMKSAMTAFGESFKASKGLN